MYKAASLKDEGVSVTTEFSMAKYFATEAAVRSAKRTIELMGRVWRDCRVPGGKVPARRGCGHILGRHQRDTEDHHCRRYDKEIQLIGRLKDRRIRI